MLHLTVALIVFFGAINAGAFQITAVNKIQLVSTTGATNQSKNGQKSRLFASSPLKPTQKDPDWSITDSSPPRAAILGIWAALVFYAFLIAPGGSPESQAKDTELIFKCIAPNAFDGTTNPFFLFVFNELGVLPLIYASILLPGGKNQKFPALPFVISSFALGFFGVGPYIGARNIQTEVNDSNKGRGTSVFEFKGTTLLISAFASYIAYQAANAIGLSGGDVSNAWNGFVELFSQQRLVHISTIDLTILSLVMWEPLREDMSRRYIGEDVTNKAILFSLIPIFGPILYLLTRPKLPSTAI
eukprot:gene11862-15872_t